MKNMIRCYLDANVLIYFQNPNSPFFEAAQKMIKSLVIKGNEILFSSLVLDEFLMGSLRQSTKNRNEMKVILKQGMKSIFRLPGFQLINPSLEPKNHLKIIDLMVKYNLKPRDAYHLFIMIENKVRYLATFDNDFEDVFKKGLIKKFS